MLIVSSVGVSVFWVAPHRTQPHAVADHAVLLFVALKRLELAFDFRAVDRVGPLLAARAAVENQLRGDLVAGAFLTGGQKDE